MSLVLKNVIFKEMVKLVQRSKVEQGSKTDQEF